MALALLLYYGGIAVIAYGLRQIYAPLAPVFCGCCMVVSAWFLARRRTDKQ